MSRADLTAAVEHAHVGAALPGSDFTRWRPVALVDKWDADQVAWARRKLEVPRQARWDPAGDELAALLAPYESVETPGNLLTTAGLNRITSLIIGGGGQALTNTAARIGTGNSSTAEAVGQTDLQAAAGSTNRWFQVMDATYPTQSNGVITLKATFASGDGNYAWSEWGVDIGTPTVTSGNTVNATLLNRKVASNGTKASGAVWAFTVTITLA